MNKFGNVEREEISNKTQIERLLEEIKSSAIGFENYKNFFQKVENSDQVILTQIENLVREFREYKAKHDEAIGMASNKQMKEDGYIRVDIYEDAVMMNKILREAYAWKTLQEELYNIIFKKISGVLDDARALDIKRDALKEMRESDRERQAVFIEIMKNYADMFRDEVTSRLNRFDEKFVNLVMMIDEDNRRDKKETFEGFRKIIEILGVDNKKHRVLNEDNEDESKLDRLNRKFPKEKEIKEEKPDRTQKREVSQRKISKNAKIDDIDKEFDSMDDDFDDDDDYDDSMN